MERRTVTGEVLLPAGDYTIPSAHVIVQVEDISRADAPSVVVGEFKRRKAGLRGGATLPFAIAVPGDRIDDRHLYSVRAHVDVSGSGAVKRGDFVSTRTYPVLTRGQGDSVSVTVQRV
jgi:uncharacterized lipoprotein YbaY